MSLGTGFCSYIPISASLRGEDNPTTTKQAERELLALKNRLGALRRYVGKMSKTALDAMAIAGVGGDDLGGLVQMEEAAQRALERLRAERPHKRRADWVTLIAASVFLRLTGTLPTLRTDPEGVAYGPFLDFLKAVFEACGIAASAEARAKAFIRKFCQPRRESMRLRRILVLRLWRKPRSKTLEFTPLEMSLSFVHPCSRSKTAVRIPP